MMASSSHPMPRRRGRPPQQRGAVLIVALIVLVALALAALSLLRSVDVLGLVANNLSLQRSALNTTDLAVNNALGKLGVLPDRTVSSIANCYAASMFETDTRGVPTVIGNTATFDTAYPTCKTTTDTGETARYVVDRQCGFEGIVEKASCILARSSGAAGDTQNPGATQLEIPTYRITVRVDGSKNARSYTQIISY